MDKGQRMKGQSDNRCWLQNEEHGIDAEASWNLKGNQNKEQKMVYDNQQVKACMDDYQWI